MWTSDYARMRWMVFGAATVLLAGVVYWGDTTYHEKLTQHEEALRIEADLASKRIAEVNTALKEAQSRRGMSARDAWAKVGALADGLPPGDATALKAYVAARRIDDGGAERDRWLDAAIALRNANEHDPAANFHRDHAKELHDLNRSFIEELGETPGTPEWERAKWFREAYESYQSLAFLGKGDSGKAADIVRDAIVALTKVFVIAPGDIRAEELMELLYARAKELNAGGDPLSGARRPRLIPGAEGDQEGRGTAPRQDGIGHSLDP